MFFLVTTRFDSCAGSHTEEEQFTSYKAALEALEFEAFNIIGEAVLQVWKAGKDFKKLLVEREV